MSRELIQRTLDQAELEFTSDDPWRRARAFHNAANAYSALASYQADPTLRMACRQAGVHYQTLAARVRFGNKIPTILPGQEAALLDLHHRCEYCGRPFSTNPTGACPECPTLLFGTTPADAEEAAEASRPVPADEESWLRLYRMG